MILLAACTPKAPVVEETSGATAGETGGATAGETDPTIGLEVRPTNLSCFAPDRPAAGGGVELERWTSLTFQHPVAVLQVPGDNGRMFVVEQGGTVRSFAHTAGAASSTVVLDVSALLSGEAINEDGLLGAAFHPRFEENGWLYVNYTAGSVRGGDLRTVVARYTSTDDGASFDPDSDEVLLEIDQPYANHNGGHLLFGPDGHLNVGLGDGGSAGDPAGNGQDPYSLLGKMLRLDVSVLPYAIPADNPWADGVGAAAEVWALGLRNPWRYSFDRATGELWVGDVGQDAYEEISVVEAGGNYGWSEMEGFHCYERGCDEALYAPPVVEVPHPDGESILGGYVYRGAAVPALDGRYVFADSYQGKFWAIVWDERSGEAGVEPLFTRDGMYPVSMGEDQDGELYVVDWMDGGLWRFAAGEAAPEDDFPATLSATGCVDPADPRVPAAGLVPYGVSMPLWSDGAEKARWLALPEGTTITAGEGGLLDLPVGSVTMKEFVVDGAAVETRLLVRHEDGYWAGYSYAWREDGRDADLLPASATRALADQTWAFPSRAECLQCHTATAGRTLGLRVEQLGPYTYPNGVTEDQLTAWARVGLVGDVPDLPRWATPDEPDAEARARAYLATNCAICHVPDGTGGGSMDLRHDTPLAEMNVCDAAPLNGTLGVEGARLLVPGDPSRSLLALRMARLDAHRMPPLGSSVVDAEGLATIEAWIAGVASCE